MRCETCHGVIADEAAFCPHCGAEQGASERSPYEPPQAPAPETERVENYLVAAILATLFCCLPAGIVSIVYAAQVNPKLQAGDLEGARQASRNAKTWALVSLGVGLAFGLMWVVFAFLGAALEA